ncbi:MAG: LysR family transcriptional regulator [Halioglobus sp.]
MDTELLKTFLEVRKTRHFGRAAQNLYITQAAVSARIKQLEESLGAKLFIRRRNNIQLSSEGERLVPHAKMMLLALARAKQDLALEDSDSRRIHIGVRTGLWGIALQEKLHTLQDKMPDLLLHVDGLEPDSLTRMLLDRTLDMAILFEPPSLPELRIVSIGQLTLKLYSAEAGESVQDGLPEHFVNLDWGGGFARFLDRRFRDQIAPALQTNMSYLASRLLVSKGGACFLPESYVAAGLADTGLSLVEGAPEYVASLNVAYHSGSAKRELIDSVVRYFDGVRL